MVVLAAKRAREIVDGMPSFIENEDVAKKQPVSIAAEEIAEDYITYSEGKGQNLEK